MAAVHFNPTAVDYGNRQEETRVDFNELMPDGEYPLKIIATEKRDNKAGTGSYILLTLEVASGKYERKWVREYLNLWNPNEQAVEIAQRKLGQLCKVLGIEHLGDSDELLNRTVQAKIVTKPGSNGFEAQNVVAVYSAPPKQLELDDDVPF
tara:strand:- start:520 stop:972 length:453 start_codon:yes stop_codon:yes gene_type:complete